MMTSSLTEESESLLGRRAEAKLEISVEEFREAEGWRVSVTSLLVSLIVSVEYVVVERRVTSYVELPFCNKFAIPRNDKQTKAYEVIPSRSWRAGFPLDELTSWSLEI